MKSLRWRLVLTLCVAIVALWSTVAAWMFGSMRYELTRVLDDRLVASTRMVAGIVQQFSHAQIEAASQPSRQAEWLSVIARDGVACEVSLVRGEVELLPQLQPIARTSNSPGFDARQPPGFGTSERGGKQWRTYVLEENGIRITTADRLDVRAHLVQSFAYAMVLPFVLALLGLLALTWWLCTRGLAPLQQLQRTLARRPPHDTTPILAGQEVQELAPMVHSLNALLTRSHAAMERERRWTADAAHELRTPLTAIKTHVQVAELLAQRAGQAPTESPCAVPQAVVSGGVDAPKLAQTPAPALSQALSQAMQGIGHMHDTLEQLLLLARLEHASEGARERGLEGGRSGGNGGRESGGAEGGNGPLQGQHILVALHTACSQACAARQAQADASCAANGQTPAPGAPRLHIHTSPAVGPAWEAADRARHGLPPLWQQVQLPLSASLLVCALRNVLDNALRHHRGSEAVQVHMALQPAEAGAGGWLQVTVRDQGPGLDEAECAQALERFWRKSASGQGSGLGLTIVQRIAQSVQGQLVLAPAPEGKGLLAQLSLPVQLTDLADLSDLADLTRAPRWPEADENSAPNGAGTPAP